MVRLHAVLDVPAEQHELAGSFWSAALGWPAGAPWPGHPELSSFEPPRGSAYVHRQRVRPGDPTAVHLDLEAADPDEDPDALVARATALGAEPTGRQDRWRSLRSPGGLAFCVLDHPAHPDPEAVTWPDGHRSRLVQVAVDAPAARHDVEVAFWRGLLAGRWVDSPAEEFAGKWHDDVSSPLQLLFQRLDEDDGPVRAHLDLGTDDQAAEVDRLLALGAQDVGEGRGGWHVLRDPTGSLFCATENPPIGTHHRAIG